MAPHSANDVTRQAENQPGPQAEQRDATTPDVPPPSQAPPEDGPPLPAFSPRVGARATTAQPETQDLWPQDPPDAPLPRPEAYAFPPQDSDEAPPPLADDEDRLLPASAVPQMPAKVVTSEEDEKEIARRKRFLWIDREAKRRLDAEEHPPLPLPPLETLRDRLARPRPAIRERIEGWLPVDARVMLAAQYKAGKTTLVCNLIRSLVDGDPWLGTAAVMPIEGCVVLIDTEMSPSQLDDWYAAQGIVAKDRVVPVSLRGTLTVFNILDATVRVEWATRLRALGTRYLVLDCLRPILDALGLDEQRDGGKFLVAFDALLVEAGISEGAVVTHMGHSGERARGDSRFRDWPDVEWRLFREHENPASARFISAYGRDVNIEESALAYNDAFRRFTLTGGGSRRDAGAHRALIAVRDALAAATEPLSGRDVEEALKQSGHSQKAIRAALRLGVKTKAILVDKNGPKGAHLHRLPPTDPATPDNPSSSASARRSAS